MSKNHRYHLEKGSKPNYCNAKVLKTGASSVAICFNDDFYGLTGVFQGYIFDKSSPKKDKSRISKSICNSSEKGKKIIKKKIIRKGHIDKTKEFLLIFSKRLLLIFNYAD